MAINKSFSLSRMLANAETSNAPEFELHYKAAHENESWQNKFGISSACRNGQRVLYIPWAALNAKKLKKLQKRDLQAAGSASQGGFTIGSDVKLGIQASLRPTSLIMRLPITVVEGCQGSLTFPRISSGVVPSNLTETAQLTTADPAFGAAQGGPYRMSAQIVFSRQLLAQSADQIDQVLSLELCRAISQEIDRLLLNGTGVNAQPLGILPLASGPNTPLTTNTYTASGGWGQAMAIQKLLEDHLIDSDSAMWLLSTATAKTWRTTLRTGNSARYILDQSNRVNNIDSYVTSFIPASSDQTVLADWSQLVLAFFGQDSLEVIFDPYTRAFAGECVLTAAVYYNGFIRRPESFIISTNAGSIFTS
jgi:HK97 family phage major capsid protein